MTKKETAGDWLEQVHVDYVSTVQLIARRDHEDRHKKPNDLGPERGGTGEVTTPRGVLKCRVFKSAKASGSDVKVAWSRQFKLGDNLIEFSALQLMGLGEPASDDPVEGWARQRIIHLDTPSFTKEAMTSKALYADFLDWCKTTGIKRQVVPPINTFSQRLRARSGVPPKVRSWGTIWPFIELRDGTTKEPEPTWGEMAAEAEAADI